MNLETLQILEFDRILEILAEKTYSEMTRNRLLELEPSTDPEVIKNQLSRVSEFRKILDANEHFPIGRFEDIQHALKKAGMIGNYLEPTELLEIKNILFITRKISGFLLERGDSLPLLAGDARKIEILPQIEERILKTIDESSRSVRADASPRLYKIHNEIEITRERIRKKIEAIQRQWAHEGFLQEAIITTRDERYVLIIKEQSRHRARGIVHDQSASGASLYIEPIETVEYNNQLRQLYLAEKREIEQILINLTNSIRENEPQIHQNFESLLFFDSFYARALFSRSIDGCEPLINPNHQLNLLSARHPLLIIKYGSSSQVIPLNLNIGNSFKTLLISGPNAGGKTVALKTIGLIALMFQSGLHVPVFPDSELPIFKNIFADIGDLQSIENDLSTFSSHIQKLNMIINEATSESLIILDEIGSGTDPEEGSALAAAILRHLTQLGALTIATTHHGSLKAFAFETNGVENGSMEFNTESLKPTYHFRLGIPGSSYAFEIAQRFGIPPKVIREARQFLGEEKRKIENLIIDLDRRIQEQSLLLKDLNIKQSKADALLKLYQEKANEIQQEEKKLKKRAVAEAEEIITQASALIEKTVKEIREQNASKAAIKQAQEMLGQKRQTLQQEIKKLVIPEVSPAYRPIEMNQAKPGLEVLWKKFDQLVKIIDIADNSNRVLIEAGHLKTRVPLEELAQLSEKKKRKYISSTLATYQMPERISSEIDIRGQRAETALDEVDKYLDQALLAGFEEVRIIHGKGTGALKDIISQFLKKHPQVLEYHEAAWNAGAAGVTIVTFKK
ncbi:endonuclease MutS2 [candidate division KSB1 bacterium]|nr:endonuclease MutS2 [candidate division KSB1 bacterium]